jgi:tetratricopeptide (TPR) repeat protein
MKKLLLTLNLTVLLLFFSSPGKASVTQIANRPVEERPEWLFNYCLEDLSGLDSLRLFKTMDSVRQWSVKEGDKKLVWYVDLFRTVFLSYRRKPADEERLLLAKKPYFETSPYPELKGAYYYFLGTMYYLRRDFEKSFHYYINSNDIFESLRYRNVPLISHYCYNFFRLYYQVGDYPSAIHFLEVQIENYSPKNPKHLPFAYNNLGVTYLKIGEVQKAQGMFRKSIDWARQLGNVVYIGIASGNYGNTLRLQGNYSEALPYLYADVALNKDAVPDNSAISCVYIANSLLHLDSMSKADRYLHSALALKPDWVWSSFGSIYYETKAIYYKKTGNYKLASLYQDSLLILYDSLKLGKNVALFKVIALQFKEAKELNERREKELQNSRLRLTRNLTITSLLLLLVAVSAYLYRQRQKERISFQRRLRQDEEKLQQAETQLEEYIEAIKEKNKMIAQIEASFDKATLEGAVARPITYEPSQKFGDHPLLTENDWQEFKMLFNVVHPDFFSKLYDRYAGLSQGETRLLALCKLQLSSQEMAAMLGISLQSVRTGRYRLRKKHPDLLHDLDFIGFI